MKDCIFCKIINNKLESKKLYEDDKVIAILDTNPNVDGHTLIIPKKHYTDFKELDKEILDHIKDVASKLTDELMKKLDTKGIALMVNYGDRQVVKHFHLHLLPNFGMSTASKSVNEIYKILKG